MSSISRRVWVTRCRWPAGCGGSPGSVTSMRSSARRLVELRGLELGRALAEQRLERRLHLVGRPCRPARAARAAARRSSAASWSARTCGPGSARAAPRARRLSPAAAMAASASLRIWVRSVSHGRPSYLPTRRGPRVAAIATFSESGRPHGDRATGRAPAPPGRPAALRRRGTSTTGGVGLDVIAARARPSRVEGELVAIELVERRAGRRAGEDRAHARPHRLGRVRVGAARPEDHRAVGQRVRGADDRPDVAGVLHAVEVDAAGRRRARPSAARKRR